MSSQGFIVLRDCQRTVLDQHVSSAAAPHTPNEASGSVMSWSEVWA